LLSRIRIRPSCVIGPRESWALARLAASFLGVSVGLLTRSMRILRRLALWHHPTSSSEWCKGVQSQGLTITLISALSTAVSDIASLTSPWHVDVLAAGSLVQLGFSRARMKLRYAASRPVALCSFYTIRSRTARILKEKVWIHTAGPRHACFCCPKRLGCSQICCYTPTRSQARRSQLLTAPAEDVQNGFRTIGAHRGGKRSRSSSDSWLRLWRRK
jgi:hypothetical protein